MKILEAKFEFSPRDESQWYDKWTCSVTVQVEKITSARIGYGADKERALVDALNKMMQELKDNGYL